MRSTLAVPVLTILLPLSALSNTAGATPVCAGPVTVTVDASSLPVTSWEPACSVDMLLIETASDGSDRWIVTSDGANAISGPARYGIVPEGAREWQEPLPLVPGEQYEAILFRWIGPGPEAWELIGLTTFTPSASVPAEPASWSAIKARFSGD